MPVPVDRLDEAVDGVRLRLLAAEEVDAAMRGIVVIAGLTGWMGRGSILRDGTKMRMKTGSIA